MEKKSTKTVLKMTKHYSAYLFQDSYLNCTMDNLRLIDG